MDNKKNNDNYELTSWEDTREVTESYSGDIDIELYCESLGKMRQALWNVI